MNLNNTVEDSPQVLPDGGALRAAGNYNLLVFNLRTDTLHSSQGFTTGWINALACRVNKVFVVTMYQGKLELAENVEVFSTGRERGYGKFRQVARFYGLLFSLLWREKIDFCFVHMATYFLILGGFFLRLRQIPVILWIAHNAKPLSLRLAHCFGKFIVTPSAASYPLASQKVHITGHGIDTNRFRPDGSSQVSSSFVVGCVSRISRQKDYKTLIEAVALLSDWNGVEDLEVRLYGGTQTEDEESYLEELKALVENKNLGATIYFDGEISHSVVPQVLKRLNVFVDTISLAGPSKAMLEAMAAGLPTAICTTACDKELGPDKELLFYKPGDPTSLALCLQKIRSLSVDERQALGFRLREMVKRHHSLENVAEQIIKLGKAC